MLVRRKKKKINQAKILKNQPKEAESLKVAIVRTAEKQKKRQKDVNAGTCHFVAPCTNLQGLSTSLSPCTNPLPFIIERIYFRTVAGASHFVSPLHEPLYLNGWQGSAKGRSVPGNGSISKRLQGLRPLHEPPLFERVAGFGQGMQSLATEYYL